MSIAFVFPGQGSQSVGMMTAFVEQFPIVESTYIDASDILGYDLWDLVQSGPETELNVTAKTQPALLVAGVAVWRIWEQQGGPAPELMAGHSLGEYTALVCSGAIKFTDAVQLVADRGAYMQAAVPADTGRMAAILGLQDEQINNVCEKSAQGQIVSAANYNSPGQVVIAGHAEAIERAVEIAKEAGAKRSIILPVSVPSHCELMQAAAGHLADRLKAVDLSTPTIPVIHNVDIAQRTNADEISQALIEQLYKPVRWVETIQMMATKGITQIVECGPGKVLSGLIKRIDKNIQVLPVYDPESLNKALSESI
ncbi:MAG: ACP S-malonyltransferase [Gammaproteobacteria bacterium]